MRWMAWTHWPINTLRLRRNEQHFADDIFKRIFFNENVRLSIRISLNFVPEGPINNNPALVQIMAWHRSGDKPLSEPMMFSLLTHICVTRPQWVNMVCCRFVWWYSYFNVFVSCIYMLYNSTMSGIGLILLFIVLLLFFQRVIRDNKLFWIWIRTWTHWGWEEMATIFQKMFSNAFSSRKIFVF